MQVNLSISKAELERCAGRCRIAAKQSEDPLAAYLFGAADVLEILTDVEHGDNEERVLSRLTMRYGWTEDAQIQ